MHQSRETPDPAREPVRAAIDSTVMLVLARFGMPITVAVLGYMLAGTLDDIKSSNKALASQVAAGTVGQAILTSRVDNMVKQIDRLQVQVDQSRR